MSWFEMKLGVLSYISSSLNVFPVTLLCNICLKRQKKIIYGQCCLRFSPCIRALVIWSVTETWENT